MGNLHAPAIADLDADSKDLISILGRTLFLLGLGSIAAVAVTGQLPLFFLPLGVFLLFGSVLQWRQLDPAQPPAPHQHRDSAATSNQAQHEMPRGYTGAASW